MNLQTGRKAYVLMMDGQILDVWSNLKKLCTEMREDTNKMFPSYSKVSKMDKLSGRLDLIGKDGKAYTIIVKVVR